MTPALADFLEYVRETAPRLAPIVAGLVRDFETQSEHARLDDAVAAAVAERFPDSSRPIEAALRADALGRATVDELTEELVRRGRDA